MKSLDLNGDNMIEISEFAHATLDFKTLPEELLGSAFNYFDKNGDKVISMEEMEPHVNKVSHYWKEIGGKSITFEEFKKII